MTYSVLEVETKQVRETDVLLLPNSYAGSWFPE